MAKKANIFSEASKLREKHPRKYSDYQDYVTWAKELHGKKTRGAVGKKPPKHKKKRSGKKLVKAKGIVHCKTVGKGLNVKSKDVEIYSDHGNVREYHNPAAIKKYGKYRNIGSVSYHKSQARKQLEEQLAWLLLSRDQAKTKRERLKLSKKVALKRQELHKMK